MTTPFLTRRRSILLLLVASGAGGFGLYGLGAACDSWCLAVLGGVVLVPAVLAANIGFVQLVQKYCPLPLQWSLAITAAIGAACLVVKLCTGWPWLGLAGVFLILPLVLMWFFWPLASFAMSVCQWADRLRRRSSKNRDGK